MLTDDIAIKIKKYINKNFPATRKAPPLDDDLLLEKGIIDSMGMLDLVTFFEKTFGILVNDEDLTAENFASVAAMAVFIRSKTGFCPSSATEK